MKKISNILYFLYRNFAKKKKKMFTIDKINKNKLFLYL